MPGNDYLGAGSESLVKLYTYWRSTASYRVRIALALKGLEYESAFVHLVRGGGEQKGEAYRVVNPQMRLPALSIGAGEALIQSPAIIEWLEEAYPSPPLFPEDRETRARVRAVASIIACDTHPLHNSGPLGYLRKELGLSDDQVSGWIAYWIASGLSAVEAMIGDGDFCFGPEPGYADVFLIPQLYAARRFNVPLHEYPRALRVEALASDHPAFEAAHPSSQPDAALMS